MPVNDRQHPLRVDRDPGRRRGRVPRRAHRARGDALRTGRQGGGQRFRVAALHRRPVAGLPVTNPFQFFPTFEVVLSDSEAERIGITSPDQADVFVTVRTAPELENFRCNLRAPILVSRGRGFQVINEAEDAPVRAPLFEALARPASPRRRPRPALQEEPHRADHHKASRAEDHARRRRHRPRHGDRRQLRALGVEAPKSLPVYREEIWAAVKEENQASARRPTPSRCPARPRAELTQGAIPNHVPSHPEQPRGDQRASPAGRHQRQAVEVDGAPLVRLPNQPSSRRRGRTRDQREAARADQRHLPGHAQRAGRRLARADRRGRAARGPRDAAARP